MKIGLLSEKIMIEESVTTVDSVGNHVNEWQKAFSCHATVTGTTGGGKAGAQSQEAGQTLDSSDLSFTVRWCKRLASLDILKFRVRFREDVYDIISIDYMNYNRRCIKLKCRKGRR